MTHAWRDSKRREWDLTLTMAGAMRIDDSDFSAITDKDFTILQPDKETFGELLTNRRLLCACAWAIVQGDPQLDDWEVDDLAAEFLDGINGETWKTLMEVFWESLSNFFPDQKIVLLDLKDQWKTSQDRLIKGIQEAKDQIQGAMDREVDNSLSQMLGELQEIKPGTTSG